MKKRRLKNWVKVLICFVIILITIVLIMLFAQKIYDQFNPNKVEKKVLATYNTVDNLKYKISVLDNPYYVEDYLGMGQQYISSVVDKIIFDVDYQLSSSVLSDYHYSYYVTATLVGKYSSDKNNSDQLWSKEYSIIDMVENTVENTNSIMINKQFEIDYQTFEKIMTQFKKEFGLTIDASLEIEVVVKASSNIENGKLEEIDTMKATIPLLQPTFYITYKTNGEMNHPVLDIQPIESNPNYGIVFLYGIIIVFLFATFIILFRILCSLSNKDEFYKKVEKILKNYAEILVLVDSIPNHDSLQTINIVKFEDMLDLEEELRVPILYYQMLSEVHFFIMTDTYFYFYKLVDTNHYGGKRK